MITTFAVHPHRTPFNEADFTAYRAPGSGVITGQLVIFPDHARYGDRSEIELLPVTPYTTEMVERELGNGERLFPANSALRKYVRITTADHLGNFAFTGLPAGEYYVFGQVEWNDQPLFDEYNQYQWGCERIRVGAGQTVHVQVTHNPGHGFAILATGTI